MEQKKQLKNIELSFVCPQNWDAMTACGDGKFCAVCQKIVYDFSNKSQKDYDQMVKKHHGQLCGRFTVDQMKPASNLAKAATLLALSLIPTALSAQEEQQRVPIPTVLTEEKPSEKEIIFGIIIEQQPEFIGGQKAMFKFLADNICYPNDTCTEGTVYVRFVVNIDGTFTNVEVKRGFAKSFDEEALRVVKLMSGKWKGGYQGGKPAKVTYILPIKFKLE